MTISLILTKRLRLRSYHAGMVTDQHIGWLNDPEVVRYSEQRHKAHTLESQHSYLNALWGNPGSNIWMIAVDDKQIGTVASHIDHNNLVANMGIMIGDKSVWGLGYGTEAWRAVMVSCFTTAKVRKIEAGCMISNDPMRNLCTKAGMVFEGGVNGHFLLNGKPEDKVMYGAFT